MSVPNAVKRKMETSINIRVIYFLTGLCYIYTLVNGLCYDFVTIFQFNLFELYEIYETLYHVLILLHELGTNC